MPATAAAGTETDRVGFHDAALTELPTVRVNAVRGMVRFTAAAGLA